LRPPRLRPPSSGNRGARVARPHGSAEILYRTVCTSWFPLRSESCDTAARAAGLLASSMDADPAPACLFGQARLRFQCSKLLSGSRPQTGRGPAHPCEWARATHGLGGGLATNLYNPCVSRLGFPPEQTLSQGGRMVFQSDRSAGMRVVRVFTKDSGDSSIEIRKVPMTGAERPMSETFGCDSIFFRETPEGHVQDSHNAPRHQLIFLTSGILEL